MCGILGEGAYSKRRMRSAFLKRRHTLLVESAVLELAGTSWCPCGLSPYFVRLREQARNRIDKLARSTDATSERDTRCPINRDSGLPHVLNASNTACSALTHPSVYLARGHGSKLVLALLLDTLDDEEEDEEEGRQTFAWRFTSLSTRI